MTDWDLMFGEVQKIVQSSTNFNEGFAKILKFAQENPEEYDEPDYWQKARTTPMPIDTLRAWAKEGFEKLQPFDKWSLMILDCGDAPDIFRMSEIHLSTEVSLDNFTQFVKEDAVRYAAQFPKAFWSAQLDIKLVYHHTNKLHHPILSWSIHPDAEYHGSNSYLLWLSVASLAVRETLRNENFCKRILKGRPQIALMSGFEEIFYYVGTISESGLQT
jgi:hypothetical protein